MPGGRDALLTLGFLKDNHRGIRLTEERTALSEHTNGRQNIIAAYDSEGQEMQTTYWIMKKSLDKEVVEQYVSKIQEFAHDFFTHVNASKSDKDQSQMNTSTDTKKRRRSTDKDEDDEQRMEPARERTVKHRVTTFNTARLSNSLQGCQATLICKGSKCRS